MKKPYMKKENTNSFIEKEGIMILTRLLENTKRFKTYFSENDKTPLFDGYFYFLDNNFKILKKIEVQIKAHDKLKILKNGPNKGKIRYEFDTAVLNSIRYKITNNPTIYFVVDCKSKQCYFKLIDKDFLISLNYDVSKKKTPFYFDESDKIENINKFIYFIEKLYATSIDEINFKSQKEIKTIQLGMNSFYHKLNELYFIKDSIWPNLWKFGIRCTKNIIFNFTNSNTGESLCQRANAFAIYPIEFGSEEKEIKDYRYDKNNMFENFDLTGERTIDDYLNDCLSQILNYYFNSGLSIKIMPDICLDEIAFSILDELTKTDEKLLGNQFQTCKYNEITINEFSDIVSPYLKGRNYIVNKDANSIDDKRVYMFFFDPFFNFSKFGLICFAEEILKECKKRNKIVIKRIWNYFIDSKMIGLARYTDELFDQTKIASSVQKLFEYLIIYTDDVINKLPIKLKNPLAQSYVYNFYLDEYGSFPFYIMDMVMKDKNCNPNFQREIICDDMYEWRSKGIFFSNLFHSRTPLFNLLRTVVYYAICKKYGVKFASIKIGNTAFDYPFFQDN